MNIDNIDEKLKEIGIAHALSVKANNRICIINHEIDSLFVDLETYKKLMHKEHQDVVKLEQMSKHFLFAKILGGREHELELERQEYLQAVLEYNAIAQEIELLEYEKSILEKRSVQMESLKKERDYYLKLKEQKVLNNNEDPEGVIKRNKGEIERLNYLIREIGEAVEVANVTGRFIKKAIYYLKSMDGFGKYPANVVTYTKKKLLNNAIKNAIQVKVNIKKLDKEMSDIYSSYELQSADKYDDFIDSFHQNLITDWVLKNQLKSALAILESGQQQIFRILATLNHDAEKSIRAIDELIEKRRLYVLNL